MMTTRRAIGGYETLRLLGEGGMGTVYLARDAAIGRLVAIKLLRPGADSPALRARLTQEARAAGRLNHPNIITIFHVGEEEGCPFIVMEYVEGQSLAALVRASAAITLARKLLILEQVCTGLACAHDAGLVHRDIKPANIIIDTMWVPKILDFGLAKIPDASLMLTHEHNIVGTLSYMAPEQLSNGLVDHRADLFAVAAVAYELVTFRRAFRGDTQQVVAGILQTPPQSLTNERDLDGAVAAIVERGLQRNPEHRFHDAREMAAAFSTARQHLADALSQESAHELVAVPSRPSVGAAVPPPRRGVDRAEGRRPVAWRWTKTVASTALVGVLAIVGLLLGGSGDGASPTENDSETAAAVTPVSAPSSLSPVVSPTSLSMSRTGADTPPRRDVAVTTPTGRGEPKRPVPIETVAPAATEEQAAQQPVPDTSPVLLPVGTVLMVNVSSILDSRRSAPGDQFLGVLDAPLLRGGREVVPAQSRVEGRVEQSGISAGRPFMELSLTGVAIGSRVVSIRTGFYRAIAPLVDRGPNFAAIVIGSTAGAAIGGVLGGGKGAMAGAAVGAIAGSAVREDITTEYHLGASLPFRIAEPVHIDQLP